MKKNLTEQIMEDFLADVFSNHFRPGEILSERMLTEAYGCSKTTMREVLAMLCQARVLRSIPRMGYEVLLVEDEEAQDTMEYRRILEVGYLRANFHRITPEVISRLRECDRLCREPSCSTNISEHWDRNTAFHMELIHATGNPFVEWNLGFVMDTQKRACVQHLSTQYDAVVAAAYMVNHDAILDAIEAGDVEGACKALEADLNVFSRL